MVLFPRLSSDHSLSYSLDKYFLSIGYVPGTVLSTGNRLVN